MKRRCRRCLLSGIIIAVVFFSIQQDARGNIVVPAGEVLTVRAGERLYLSCHTNRWATQVWSRAALGESLFRLVNTSVKTAGFNFESHRYYCLESGWMINFQFDTYARNDLWKESVSLSDAGSYRCYSQGRLADTVNVNVIEMELRNGYVDVLYYNDTSLVCRVGDSRPRLDNFTVTWYRRDVMMTSSPNKYTINNDSITVHRVGDQDIGVYVCVVKIMTKISEEKYNISYELSLNAHPVVRCSDRSKNSVVGSSVELICTVDGWPTPTVTWYRHYDKDNMMLPINATLDRRIEIHVEDRERGSAVTGEDEESRGLASRTSALLARLSILEVQLSDRSTYSCVAMVLDPRKRDRGGRGEERAMGQGTSSGPAGGGGKEETSQLVSTFTVLLRVKSRYAALWPFLGICLELLILFIIIFFYERKQQRDRVIENMHQQLQQQQLQQQQLQQQPRPVVQKQQRQQKENQEYQAQPYTDYDPSDVRKRNNPR